MNAESIEKYRLTNREKDILDILWESPESLVASEVTAAREDLSINTVQAVLKKLLQKELIQIDEIVYSGTVLSRSYKPTLSPERFEVQKFIAYYAKASGQPYSLAGTVAALMDVEEDPARLLEEIAQTEAVLASRKKELNSKQK